MVSYGLIWWRREEGGGGGGECGMTRRKTQIGEEESGEPS